MNEEYVEVFVTKNDGTISGTGVTFLERVNKLIARAPKNCEVQVTVKIRKVV